MKESRYKRPGQQRMLARAAGADKELQTEEEQKTRKARAKAQGRVLVVEDKEDEVEEWRYLLEEEGFEVLSAKTRKEGLRLAQQGQLELVVVDLALPEGDGKEFALEIKLLPDLARVPVVGIGATALDGKASDPRKIFAAYLTKPIAREKFRKTVRDLLGRRVTREVKARRDRPLKVKS